MNELQIVEVQNRRDLKNFIFLPGKLHGNQANWLPPLYMDEWAFFNPEKNPSMKDNPTILFLAYRGSELCGRIMGIIPSQYNQINQVNSLRFSHLECINDEKLVGELLRAVVEWGKRKGMEKIIGPFGFSDKDPEGLQIEGFDYPSILVTATNDAYLPGLVEKAGFTKMIDCLDYLIDLKNDIPKSYSLLFDRLKSRLSVRLVEPKNKKELRKYIFPVFSLINRSYQDIYGFVPLSDKEISGLVKRYLPILDVRFVKIVVDLTEQVKGVIIGMPHLTDGIIKARGRLFPLGIFYLLQAAKRTRQLDLMIGAVDAEMRGRGIDLLLGWSVIESAKNAGMKTIETHLVLETNHAMRAEYERIGAKLIKKFRIYTKDI